MPFNYPAHSNLPMQRPNPSPLPRVLADEEVDAHRSVHCPHYEDCLDEAVNRSWDGWSCASCPMHRGGGAVYEIQRDDKPRRAPPPKRRDTGRVALVLGVMREGGHWRAGALSLRLGVPQSVIAQDLSRLRREKRILLVARGLYSVAP